MATTWADRAVRRLAWRERRAAEAIGRRAAAWFSRIPYVEAVWLAPLGDTANVTVVLASGASHEDSLRIYGYRDPLERPYPEPDAATLDLHAYCPTDFVGEPAFRPWNPGSRCLWRRDSAIAKG